MIVATLVALDTLGQGEVSAASDRLAQAGCAPTESRWIEPAKAVDILVEGDAAKARAALDGTMDGVDIFVQPTADRVKTLIVADMDSTMITVECIDELADYAGIKAQIAEITERAMQGELDFAQALSARVALLRSLPDAVIDQCRAERVQIMPGAKTLIRTIKAIGGHAILVSGGFTRFAEPVAAEIGFDRAIANVLGIADGALTGTVEDPIVDSARKQVELEAATASLGLRQTQTLAIGDGANDIPMIRAAGLGVAYHAKAKARAAADGAVDHGDLTTVLYAMGLAPNMWTLG